MNRRFNGFMIYLFRLFTCPNACKNIKWWKLLIAHTQWRQLSAAATSYFHALEAILIVRQRASYHSLPVLQATCIKNHSLCRGILLQIIFLKIETLGTRREALNHNAQTQVAFVWIGTPVTLIGGECCHHCAIPALDK